MYFRLLGQLRHLSFALVGIAFFGLGAAAFVYGAVEETTVTDDPVALSERALRKSLTRPAAEREIESALAGGDIEIAQGIVDLAVEHDIAVDPALVDQVKDPRINADSAMQTAGRFVHGLWSGEPTDGASLAGTLVSDLFVFGDIRDAARESAHYLTGRPTDFWVLGLSGAGIVMTAVTFSSLGASMPARMGFSVVKAVRRLGRFNPVLAGRLTRDAVKVSASGEFAEFVRDVGRIESNAGTQAALDGLQSAENPQEVSRIARIAVAKGGKTRAILKLVGPTAKLLAASALTVAMWTLWAALMLFGFVSSCKATAERITLRYLQRRKLRALSAASAASAA
jgi:hypothetical protein